DARASRGQHRPDARSLPGPAAPVTAPHRGSRRRCRGRRSQQGRKVSMISAGWDDDALLAALREALRAREAVPPEFVEAAKSAVAGHNSDAALAKRPSHSSREGAYEPSLRAEAASIRALTFTSAHLTIELEVTQDALLGQIIPAQAGVITVQPRDGAETEYPA